MFDYSIYSCCGNNKWRQIDCLVELITVTLIDHSWKATKNDILYVNIIKSYMKTIFDDWYPDHCFKSHPDFNEISQLPECEKSCFGFYINIDPIYLSR